MLSHPPRTRRRILARITTLAVFSLACQGMSGAQTVAPSSGMVRVEADPPYPIWLPAPGPSRDAALAPSADAARQRGLAAAARGDWPAAVKEFKEARKFAHGSPALMFNLALALQRGGWDAPAALWFRTYLAAMPDAPNAAAIAAEAEKSMAAAEARARSLWDEAERLALQLSDRPASPGARSLRQAALEDIASYAYMAGQKDRADALVRKATSLPGARDVKTPRTYWDQHGLYAAYYASDARRADDIVKQFGKDYDARAATGRQVYAHWNAGDFAGVRRLIDLDPGFSTGLLEVGVRTRTYALLEILLGRGLANAKVFEETWYPETIVPAIEAAFWDGRPDLATSLARRAVAHYRRFQLSYYRTAFPRLTDSFESDRSPHDRSYGGDPPSWSYLFPLAVLGDRAAIIQEIQRWKTGETSSRDFGGEDNLGGNDPLGRTALALAVTLPAAADELITRLQRWRFSPSFDGELTADEKIWPVMSPLSFFARASLRGDSAGALKALTIRADRELEEPMPQETIRRALDFAAATGRASLAFDIAGQVEDSRAVLAALNRLALNQPGARAIVERLDRLADTVTGGWRPANTAQAWKVWHWLDHEKSLDDESQYGPLPANIDESAKSKPEKLPGELAAHAWVLWTGAMAARVER